MKNYQSQEPCIACCENRKQRCYHHVTTRKAGGKDTTDNLMSLCFKCHTEMHYSGLSKMCKKYSNVYDWLVVNKRYDKLRKMEIIKL